MKFAIVSLFGHYECLFFLCEVLQEYEVTLYIGDNTRGEELSLCKLYSNINVIKINTKLTEEIVSLYDIIIKLTSTDDVLEHSNVISILHLSLFNDNKSKKYISLTPYVKGENVSYMLSVHNPLSVKLCYNKSITFVGHFLNGWVDEDLQYFIENSNHRFNFVVWGDGYYNNLTKYSNVNVYYNASNEHLNEIINNSSYIMLRNASYIHYDRFTGMIALALSFKKPLIIDKQTKDAYKIPGIVYEKRFSELIDTMNTEITPIVYEKLVDSISKFNKEAINQNKKIIEEICYTK